VIFSLDMIKHGDFPIKHGDFPLIIDPENSLVLMETHFPIPICQGLC
jgi:hypothetical protein